MIADEETKKIIEENRLLKARLEALEAKPAASVPAGERAEWIAIKPIYISAQDCYIEEGETFEWTGIPNECMEPKNDPAKRAMRAYLEMMPQGIKPDIADISEAATMLRPKDGDALKGETQEEWLKRVAKLAKDLAYNRQGLKPPVEALELPHRIQDIPVVGNDPKVAAEKRRTAKDIAKILPPEPAKKKAPKITGAPNESPVF